uniref:Uncharacterized protein n=1 Tax=Molossus molossus TaxID=27622 RepID=A0A7J8DQE2_MOLMO|nr:hypothetical protein HJG59_009262 [Molossus molossus]
MDNGLSLSLATSPEPMSGLLVVRGHWEKAANGTGSRAESTENSQRPPPACARSSRARRLDEGFGGEKTGHDLGAPTATSRALGLPRPGRSAWVSEASAPARAAHLSPVTRPESPRPSSGLGGAFGCAF